MPTRKSSTSRIRRSRSRSHRGVRGTVGEGERSGEAHVAQVGQLERRLHDVVSRSVSCPHLGCQHVASSTKALMQHVCDMTAHAEHLRATDTCAVCTLLQRADRWSHASNVTSDADKDLGRCAHSGCTFVSVSTSVSSRKTSLRAHAMCLRAHREHFERHGDNCAKCKELVAAGVWTAKGTSPQVHDDYACSHLNCTWKSSASTPSSRKYSIYMHERGFRCHRSHFEEHGKDCKRCQENIANGTWVVQEDGTVVPYTSKKFSSARAKILSKKRKQKQSAAVPPPNRHTHAAPAPAPVPPAGSAGPSAFPSPAAAATGNPTPNPAGTTATTATTAAAAAPAIDAQSFNSSISVLPVARTPVSNVHLQPSMLVPTAHHALIPAQQQHPQAPTQPLLQQPMFLPNPLMFAANPMMLAAVANNMLHQRQLLQQRMVQQATLRAQAQQQAAQHAHAFAAVMPVATPVAASPAKAANASNACKRRRETVHGDDTVHANASKRQRVLNQ